ncbi:MAG: 6,7-dimethyl-8-ribityllumazine synthase [Planctomycetota bacterium]|nr:6,7-dimethyl-8-ribityllumazine synthase [Planctomycetota bacterium]
MPSTLEPNRSGSGRRIGVVVSRFTEEISQRLLDSTVATLVENGVADADITVVWVPGSFELPLVCDTYAESRAYDAIITLGCVIRGETSHFDYVCENAARGILDAGLRHQIPVIFGVLTTENRSQAEARAGGDHGDKGRECALAALEMIGVIDAIDDGP